MQITSRTVERFGLGFAASMAFGLCATAAFGPLFSTVAKLMH